MKADPACGMTTIKIRDGRAVSAIHIRLHYVQTHIMTVLLPAIQQRYKK